MSEQYRRCTKCGRFATQDPKVVLYRFPKPGVTNVKRCELWAKYCFPDEQWSSTVFQTKLYSEHRMLCSLHFHWTSFSDYDAKKLHRHAAPQDECKRLETVPEEPTPCPSYLADITNVTPSTSTAPVPTLKRKFQTLQENVEPVAGPSTCSRNVGTTATPKILPGTMEKKRKLDSNQERTIHVPGSRSSQKVRGQTHMLLESPKKRAKCLDPVNQKLYAKCRKYMKRVCALRNTLKKEKMKNGDVLKVMSEDEALKKMSEKLTPTFALLLQGELWNFKKKPCGRRWTQEEKVVALRLFKRSPTCYRLLCRMICLPNVTTIKTLLAHFNLPTGVHQKVLLRLSDYTKSQKPSDNTFILMFDEMSIKKNLFYNMKLDQIDGVQDHGEVHGRDPVEATHALVFMVAGLRKKVKQPIAHYFSSAFVTADRVAVLIKEVLQACFDAGVCVVATVCDMDGVNRRALTILGATESQPVIKFGTNDIVTLFDTPHLLKCFRNLFLKYDLKCSADISSMSSSGQGVAKWSHIKEFYEVDNMNPNFVFAPCLTKEHLAPNNKQKMKVKLAAQVLSHSVAAGMYAKISAGQLTTQATVTANVLSKMDKLFDCLNSETPDLRRGKPCSTNLSQKSPHFTIFDEMKKFFSEMEFVGCRSTPPSTTGWLWTICGVRKLWELLSKKHPDIKTLATRRLQQDPLENLFGCIRANCGSNYNPTVSQFVGGLKTAVLSNLTHMANTGNCEKDSNEAIVTQISALLEPTPAPTTDTDNAEAPLVSEIISANEHIIDEHLDDSGELQACAYVCGFILKNIKQQCEKCEQVLSSEEAITSIHNFVQHKEYRDLKTSLKYASGPFVNCVEQCATLVSEILPKERHIKKLKHQLIDCMKKKIDFKFLLGCPVHFFKNRHYIVHSVFYICTKRYCVLKNRQYAEQSSIIALQRKVDILKHK